MTTREVVKAKPKKPQAGEEVRAALRVPGTPLEPALRARFEAAFNCDLGHVRIHTDTRAQRAAREIDAHAFAVGRDVFFSAGAFEPHTTSGRALIAHELAHAIEDPRAIEPADADRLALTEADSSTEHNANDAVTRAGRGIPLDIASAPAPKTRPPQIARFAIGMLLRDPRDPAQLVATLVRTIKTALGKDPDDRLGRVRRSLDFLDEDTRKLALERLSHELLSTEWTRLSELLEQKGPEGASAGDGRETSTEEAKSEVATTEGKTATATTAEKPPEKKDADEKKPAEKKGAEAEKPAEPGAESDASKAKEKLRLHLPQPKPKKGGVAPHAPARSHAGAAPSVALPKITIPEGAPAPAPAPGADALTQADADALNAPPGAGPARSEAPESATPDAPEAAATEEAAPETEPAAQAEPAAAEPAQAEPVAAEPAPSLEAPPPEEPPPVEPAPAAEAEVPAAAEAPAAESATESPATESPAAESPAAETPAADAPAAGASPPVGDLPTEADDNTESPQGGGGGGSALPAEEPEPPASAPPEGEPSEALTSVADEPPHRLGPALEGVRGSVNRTVGSDRSDLATNPPTLSPESAAQIAKAETAEPSAAAPTAAPPRMERIPPGAPPPPTVVPQAQEPGPAPEIRSPRINSNADGKLTAEDAQAVSGAIDELPTTDPELDKTIPSPPDVELTGAADPAQADAQRDKLAEQTQSAADAGKIDAAAPLGEDHIVPKQPLGTVKADPVAAGPQAKDGGAAPAGSAGADAPDAATAIVAREKSADEVAAQAHSGATDLAQKRTEQRAKETQERADSQKAVDDEIAENTEAQKKAREDARAEVGNERKGWTKEQNDLVKSSDDEGTKTLNEAHDDVNTKRKDARAEAQRTVDKGNQDCEDARKKAQDDARAAREKAKREKEDAGWLSRAANAIGDFFDKIKGAIKGFFNWARDKIKKAFDWVKNKVTEIIDKVKNAIISAIKAVGDALIAIGDRLLAAFPGLRDKFRKAIHTLVDKAVAAVNHFADLLKKGITALLNLLSKALMAILDAYEALYLAAVNVVAGYVKAVINAAKAIVMAIGVFAGLIRDVARDPGGWIRNFGSACYDGLKSYLWTELKKAVKEWFNSKVEAVVGVAKFIYNILLKGKITFAQIGKMAWAAVKAAIPPAIIQFLIEKIIAMIIPAAGAIMAIIEGLQAAWATVSRIIAAFERFVAFLKSVKDGGATAAVLFARAVAAAAVAVIDFTANFILQKIGKAAKGLGTKLKSIASKIMSWFRKGAKLVKRGATAVGRAIVRAGKAIAKGARAVGRGLAKVGRAIAKSRIGQAIAKSRLGRFVGRQVQKVKAMAQRARDRFKKWREDRKRRAQQRHDERVQRAQAELPGKIAPLIERHASKASLYVRLKLWQLQYRLHSLSFGNQTEESFDVIGSASPPFSVFRRIVVPLRSKLLETIRKVAESLKQTPTVKNAIARLYNQRMGKSGLRVGSQKNPYVIEPGPGVVAEAFFQGENRPKKGTLAYFQTLGAPELVRQRQTYSRGVGHIYVENAGTYADIEAAAKRVIPGRLSEGERAMQFGALEKQIVGAGFSPKLLADPSYRNVASLAPIEQVRIAEMARDRAQIVRQSLQMSQMESGHATIHKSLIERNPMEFQTTPSSSGAVKRASGAAEELGFKPQQEYARPASDADIQAFMDREFELLVAELYTLMSTTEPMIANQADLESFVRTKFGDLIRTKVMKDFNL